MTSEESLGDLDLIKRNGSRNQNILLTEEKLKQNQLIVWYPKTRDSSGSPIGNIYQEKVGKQEVNQVAAALESNATDAEK